MFSKLLDFFRRKNNKEEELKPEIKPETKKLIEDIHTRMTKANGATIQHYSLENEEAKNAPKREIYKKADFVNKDCTKLEDFIINDDINNFDLIKLAELNGVQLQISGMWYPLVVELMKELHEHGWDRKVSCIKEKFAQLRFYTADEYDEIVEKYTKRSEHICESCGERGEIRYNTGWDYVACRKHYVENRGSIKNEEKGFNHNGQPYQWSDVKDIQLEDLNHNDIYRFLTIEINKDLTPNRGWTTNKIYVSNSAIGFGKFLAQLPTNYPNLDYAYIEPFKNVAFCEICGYEAVYQDHCECCENPTWKSYQVRWQERDEKRIPHIKEYQMDWTLDEGEKYEAQQKHYPKNPAYKVLFTEEEMKEYLEDYIE